MALENRVEESGRQALPYPAGSAGVEREGRVPHGETRYLSGSTERVQELKQQQNRNRNSEEGLQSDGEENGGLGDGSRPHLLQAPGLASAVHSARGQGRVSACTQGHAPCVMLQDTPGTPGSAPQRRGPGGLSW